VLVKFRGSVEDVTAAVAAAEEAVNRISGVVTKHIISGMSEEAEGMLKHIILINAIIVR
jgi:microcompartment protein CcmL/EutN